MSVASPLAFFLLVFALSLPFWWLGTVTGLQLLPGLQVGALQAFCPAAAAVVLVYRENGGAGVKALLGRAFDVGRVGAKAWYVPALLLAPSVTVLSYWSMRVMGMPLPIPRISALAGSALFLAFFASALGEELGWSGFATDPLQARWSALGAAILLGVVMATWHVVPLVQAHRPVAWIAGWYLGTVASRVLIVWLYNNTGRSVFVTALFHTSQNVSWQLFPNQGSHWDPRILGPMTAVVAVIVVAGWGPRTLAGSRPAPGDRRLS